MNSCFFSKEPGYWSQCISSWLDPAIQKPTCVRIQLKFIRPRAMQRICDLSVGVGVQVCCRNFQNEVSWRYIFTDFASVEKLKMKDKEEGDCGRYAKIQRDRVTE